MRIVCLLCLIFMPILAFAVVVSDMLDEHLTDGLDKLMDEHLTDGLDNLMDEHLTDGLDNLMDENGILWDDMDTLPDVSDTELDRVGLGVAFASVFSVSFTNVMLYDVCIICALKFALASVIGNSSPGRLFYYGKFLTRQTFCINMYFNRT